jgi:hypothetical protein
MTADDAPALPAVSGDLLGDPRPEAVERLLARTDGAADAAVLHAVLAWHHARLGRSGEVSIHVVAARSAAESLPRRVRHVVAILTLAAEGHVSRATGLAAEHLCDFPDDRVVALVARRSVRWRLRG